MADPQEREQTALVSEQPAVSELAWSVAEAAARVGLTAATLRTWHRRYGLGPSVRTAGGHRRYNASDLARLRAAADLVDSGVPPSEAVAAANDLAIHGGPTGERPPSSRAGGGRVLALPEGTEIQRGLARAAMSLDAGSIQLTVTDLIDRYGVVAAWQDVLVPVLVAVGDRWDKTERGVEIEHILSGGIATALLRRGTPVSLSERPVLLACVPEEQHALALLALHVALQEAGVPSVLLGARVPAEALHDAVKRLRPRQLVLWASLPQWADAALVDELPRLRPPVGVVLAGPGWHDDGNGDNPQSLAEALDLLVRA